MPYGLLLGAWKKSLRNLAVGGFSLVKPAFLFYTTSMSKTTDWVIDDLMIRSYDLLNKEETMELTACGKCKHLLKMPGMWKEFNHGLFCRAMPKQGEFNCFNGEYEKDSFWRCNEVNKGCCSKFEEEE